MYVMCIGSGSGKEKTWIIFWWTWWMTLKCMVCEEYLQRECISQPWAWIPYYHTMRRWHLTYPLLCSPRVNLGRQGMIFFPQTQLLIIVSANIKPLVKRLYHVATVRSCNVPPFPMERDLHCPLVAIQMALISLTLSMRSIQQTGSNLQSNSLKLCVSKGWQPFDMGDVHDSRLPCLRPLLPVRNAVSTNERKRNGCSDFYLECILLLPE